MTKSGCSHSVGSEHQACSLDTAMRIMSTLVLQFILVLLLPSVQTEEWNKEVIASELNNPRGLKALPSVQTEEWNKEVIASGLNNPRGLKVGPDGALYVATSGSGGQNLVEEVSLGGGQPADACQGDTGSISKIDDSGDVQVVANFGSVGAVDENGMCPGPGIATIGPADVVAEDDGSLTVVMGLGGAADQQSKLGASFGTLQKIADDGTVSTTTDIAAFEIANDPGGDGVDSNPYAIALAPNGGYLVVDAGGNTLLHVKSDGTVEVVANFGLLEAEPYELPSCGVIPGLPDEGTMVPAQSVPTDVVVGPDGAFYVSILGGFPFAIGSAKVYRVDPATKEVSIYVNDLNHVTGLDFGPDGSLFVAQITDDSLIEIEVCQVPDPTPGSVIKINAASNTREVIGAFGSTGDVAVDPSTGEVYVTTGSTLPATAGGGSVMKLTQPASGGKETKSRTKSTPKASSKARSSDKDKLPEGPKSKSTKASSATSKADSGSSATKRTASGTTKSTKDPSASSKPGSSDDGKSKSTKATSATSKASSGTKSTWEYLPDSTATSLASTVAVMVAVTSAMYHCIF